MELNRCINSSTCLPREPRVVRVDRGCSSNAFVSNAAYKVFMRWKFNITTMDMETAAVLLVCFEQNIPFIAIRAVSGGGSFQLAPSNAALFTALASQNAVSVATRFISLVHKSQNGDVYRL
jgi:nucleoside phosphorylase